MSERCKKLSVAEDKIQGSFASLRMTASGVDSDVEFDEDDEAPFDKLREECGVMAVYNHADAARMTYWVMAEFSAS